MPICILYHFSINIYILHQLQDINLREDRPDTAIPKLCNCLCKQKLMTKIPYGHVFSVNIATIDYFGKKLKQFKKKIDLNCHKQINR